MKKIIILLLIVPFIALSQNQKYPGSPNPVFTVFLIGDAGKDTLPGNALKLLGEKIRRYPNSAVVFLGDNVYPRGIEINGGDTRKSLSQKKMMSQLNLFKQYPGKVYMVPGNHDWKNGRWGGAKNVIAEAEFTNSYLKKNSEIENKNSGVFFPVQALPGPVSIELFAGQYAAKPVRLILIDTQWFLQKQFFHKVGKLPGLTKKETEQKFFIRLDSMLNAASQKGEHVLIAAHHPIFSNGHHSKQQQPWRWFTNIGVFQPFGILGGNRLWVQNLNQPRYKKLREQLLAICEKYPGIIYVSGHEHNLQYFTISKNNFIVSGSGSSITPKEKQTINPLFENYDQHGFFSLSFFYDDSIILETWGADKKTRLFDWQIK